ncbi:hypothetical protein GJ744_000402 [Endocarpon pusillum]|uniref:Uncharacterized protein n=1 Tax=Endocarpon pusillum TaxID=364733 RepID=A0A8H7E1D7_9EURO|nr:hypothetical protein GJ744_000402 [Endocarpon pusillum]
MNGREDQRTTELEAMATTRFDALSHPHSRLISLEAKKLDPPRSLCMTAVKLQSDVHTLGVLLSVRVDLEPWIGEGASRRAFLDIGPVGTDGKESAMTECRSTLFTFMGSQY